jgi:fructosamine-3-kinase
MKKWKGIVQHIEEATGKAFSVNYTSALSGGSINAAFMLSDEKGQQYFVKTNKPGQKAMFVAEVAGLKVLAESETLKVPKPICCGGNQDRSYIVTEYLSLKGRADQTSLGEQLAAMHRHTTDYFGWQINNTIGGTPQLNAQQDDWVAFWREQRLGYQLQLAAKNGYTGELQVLGERLLVNMPALFAGRAVDASMLHGDLWGGNVAGLSDGTPVIFDPAFYYGDREADLAMTYVFGGFTADFYAAYQEAWPVDEGFAVRKIFYNLYHIINHLNMFGGGYHSQAIHMLEQVLAEIG